MPEQNNVYLLGEIIEVLNEEKTRFKLAIKKNKSKFDYPVVKLIDNIEDNSPKISVGRKVFVEGQFATKTKVYEFACPYCNAINEVTFEKAIIISSKITAIEACESDAYHNKVILKGRLCSDPDFSYIPGTLSKVPSCSYTLESNRKYNGKNRPLITTYAKQAEEDIKHLQTASQILVDGAVSTRKIGKKFQCRCCHTERYAEKELLVIQGNRIEYLANCKF